MRIRLPRPLLVSLVALAAVLGLPSRSLEAQAGPPLTVTISGPTGTILSGAQTTYTANAAGGAGGFTYTWTLGDGRSATGNPITTSWSTQGSYTLTCIVRDAQGVSATASRTVTVVRAPTLTITPGNPVLYKGGSVLLRVFMNTLQTTNTTVTIVSADTNIATVTPSVLIPPGDNSTLFEVEAKTVGATRITASLPAALGGGSASTTVTVTAGPLISITPLAAYVALGGSFDYTLTISDKQATNTSISLSSLNILVASLPPTVVLPAGALSVSFPVKGEALGTTTIKAALPPELGGTSVTAAFTVGTSTFPRLTLSPTSLTLAPGETGRVTATLSTAIDGGVTVTLASSNPSVATVPASVPITPVNLTASFDVKALAPGVTTLTATLPANLGSGSWTLPVQVTGCAAAGAPTISVGPPRIPGGSNLLVKWTAASNLAGSYLLEASTNASFTAPLFFTARTKALSALVPTSSVSSEQVLYVRVKAIQDCGTVTPSAVVTVRLSPAIARFLFTRGAAPLGARVGGTPPSTTVVVRNAGGASGKITLLARGSFFDVSPVEAEVPAGGETTLTLTARASALTAPAALVGALEGSSGNQKIATSVSLTVTAQEPAGNAGRKARATATTVLFQAPEGQNPAPQTIDVTIPGLAAGQSLELAPRIGPGGNWLDVTGSFVVPPSGTVRLTLSVDRSRRTESDGPTPPYRTLLTLQPVGAAPEDAAVIEVLDAPRPNVTAGGGRTRRPGSPGDADRLVSPALTGGSFIVPVCVKSGGSFGAAFFSDGWVRNITSEPVAADFYYTPDGKDGLTDSGVLKSTITVPGNTTVRLSDMLAALFDATGSGQVELRTASPEALTLRTAVESVTGGDPALRFGTEIPTVASGSGTGLGLSPLVIPGVRGDATFRTNLLLAETTGAPVDVLISVYDALGTRLGSTTASVPAYGKVQINGLVTAVSAGATLALGSAEVSVTAGSGRVVPLATVLDNRSNSFSALRGNTVGDAVSRSASDLPTSYAVPAAVRTLGAFNTQFLTGLTLVNGVGSPARLTLSYIYVDQDDFNQVKTVAKDVTIPGRGSLPVDKADDVILNLFGVGNRSYGWIKIEGDILKITASGAISALVDPTNPVSGLKTAQVEGVTSNSPDILVTGDLEQRFAGVEKSVAKRTNLVLVETAGASCDVRVRLYTPAGDPVGEKIVSLAPLQYLQITDVFGLDGVGLGDGPFQNFEVTAQVVAGEGRPVALATVNDNISRNPEIFLLKESGAPVSTIGF